MLPYVTILNIRIPMYGLCVLAGLAAAGAFSVVKVRGRSLPWDRVFILAAFMLPLGFLGAKLLFLFVTYSPRKIIFLMKNGGFSSLLSGGFVYYGGLAGGAAGYFCGIKAASASSKDYEDIITTSVPLAHAFGRIGCFFAGCCYGIPVSHLGVIYRDSCSLAPLNERLFPVQIIEALFCLLLFLLLRLLGKKERNRKLILPLYLIIYSAGRFVLEFLRYDEVRGSALGLSTSQWLGAAAFIIGVLMLALRLKNKRSV